MIVVLVLLGFLVFLSGAAVAPFNHTLFLSCRRALKRLWSHPYGTRALECAFASRLPTRRSDQAIANDPPNDSGFTSVLEDENCVYRPLPGTGSYKQPSKPAKSCLGGQCEDRIGRRTSAPEYPRHRNYFAR